MKSLFRFPIYFFIAGMTIGLMLRWHFVLPFENLAYMNWLHAHSHTMFLGWVFNLLIAAFIYNHIAAESQKLFKRIFIFIQLLLVGMMISFPLQGYGMISITLLILHMVGGSVFAFFFYKKTRQMEQKISLQLVYAALLFFVISSLGALAVGPLAAAGLQGSKWYFYAIYFYLHFQYNGVFIFGVLALFFQLLEHYGVSFPAAKSSRMASTLFIASFPSYLLSVLWGDSPWWIIILAALAAILQLISLFFFLQVIKSCFARLKSVLTTSAGLFILISLVAYSMKILLQALSAFPVIAVLASQVRFFVIAYLHLVLIGVVTFFLIGWLIQKGIIGGISKSLLYSTTIAFIVSEVIMVMVPLLGGYFQILSVFLLIFSFLLTLGFTIILLRRSTFH